ncbi:ExeA family protein [Arthrobacter sp. CG_A4]|uniref:ExeA family protein n=1 Tax=Arthrobacter sp. CG_A4 TaxID=3071706 RepID=UPI002E146934
MSISNLQSHYGFTTMPFGRSIPAQALHPHPSHREAIARIQWCVAQRQMGVVTGEVGAGKTVAVRAALAQLEASRHQIIYIADPTIGMRGIQSQIVTALGGQPAFYSGVLAHQTASLLAGELDERSRLPVVVIDEAHLLGNTDLESLRMLRWTPAATSHCCSSANQPCAADSNSRSSPPWTNGFPPDSRLPASAQQTPPTTSATISNTLAAPTPSFPTTPSPRSTKRPEVTPGP